MLGSRHSLVSVLFLIVFLFLASLAARIYSSDAEQKAKMEENFFWKNTFVAVDAVVPLAKNFFDFILAKDTSSGRYNASSSATEISAKISEEAVNNVVNQTGKSLLVRVREEWEKSEALENETASSSLATGTSPTSLSDYLAWQKNASGAELVWRAKNGEEYKLSLPFKFFGESSK